MGGKSSPPPAPDYRGAAEATAASSREANTAQTWANRPNMTTPWGTSTWTSSQTVDPATGLPVTSWSNDVRLTPEQQQALDGQQRLQNARTGTAESLLGRAQNAFQTPFSTDGMSDYYRPNGPAQLNTNAPGMERMQGGGGGVAPIDNSDQLRRNVSAPGSFSQGAMQAIEQRMRPMQDRQRSQLQTQLANQGIQVGSEAYKAAMDDIGRQENDARLGAITQGYQQGNNEFQQDLAGGQFQNLAVGQQFGQRANQAQIGNQAAQFNTSSNMNAAQGNNASALQRLQAGNQAALQQQDAGQNFGSYAAQLRAQQMQEALTRRNMPLNEMNAFLTGQQVQAPQFNGPNSTANRANGTDYLGAANMQGQYGMQQAQMNNQNANSFMSGLFGLGGAALGAPTGTFRFGG